MAAPIETTRGSFSQGVPVALFDSHSGVPSIYKQYGVTKDGQRFLIATNVQDPAPPVLSVIVNWPSEIAK